MRDDFYKKLEETNKIVFSQNQIILSEITKANSNRHVEEENEPVMKDIINNFNIGYAKTVASKSMLEIINFLKDENDN